MRKHHAPFGGGQTEKQIILLAGCLPYVVHHVLCRVTDPIWESRFIHDTYACRPDKGTHRALDRCQHFARRYEYVLQCDVHQFFPAIDLASRILNTAFACHEELVRARKVTGADRERALVAADTDLEALRVQWRLAHELRYISTGQYQHGAKRMDEVGRLLGSWRKG